MLNKAWTANTGDAQMSHYLKFILGHLILSKDMRELGEDLVETGSSGAEVVGRGTIVVDGKVIASSSEFKRLQESARRIVNSRNTENHTQA